MALVTRQTFFLYCNYYRVAFEQTSCAIVRGTNAKYPRALVIPHIALSRSSAYLSVIARSWPICFSTIKTNDRHAIGVGTHSGDSMSHALAQCNYQKRVECRTQDAPPCGKHPTVLRVLSKGGTY